MLLDFKGSNFKSFGEEFDFKMTPERITELNYTVLSEKIHGKNSKALSTSVIYGSNAAGKTSIINAMSCLREIIAKGSIKNSDNNLSGDYVSEDMSLIPFKFSKEEHPVTFDITFVSDGMKIRYALSFEVGTFLDYSFDRFISKESLWINDHPIFVRTEDEVESLELGSVKYLLNNGFDMESAETIRHTMSKNIIRDTLLLTTDFNSFCSKKIVSCITQWMGKKFMVINSSNQTAFFPMQKEGTAFIDKYINKIAKEAGIIGSDFAYITDNDNKPHLISTLNPEEYQYPGIDAKKVESLGTLRLIAIMPAIVNALKLGATLVIDEFDASLHPSLVMNIISIFHNDEINKNRAQLIFNTQNPVYLDRKLLRRDEIKFVERNPETKSSDLYELADFRTNGGEVSVRKTSDYLKNYFVDRYGAILDIDFSDILQEMMENTGE